MLFYVDGDLDALKPDINSSDEVKPTDDDDEHLDLLHAEMVFDHISRLIF